MNEDILCNIRQDARVQYNENNCRSTMKPEKLIKRRLIRERERAYI